MDDRTLVDLQLPRVLDAAAGCCRTARGRDLVRMSPPLPDLQACDEELALVEEGMLAFELPERPVLDGVEDMGHAFAAAAKGAVLAVPELVACARMLSAGAQVQHSLKEARLRVPGLAAPFLELKDLTPVAERVADTFDDEGRIRDDASPRLAELRAKAVQLGRRVKALVEDLVRDPRMQPILQDDYYTIREGRYVLPVKAEDHRFVPGIIHGSSQTGATLFIEPSQIVEDNNQLKVVLESIEVEEHAIRADRSRLLGKVRDDARLLADALWGLDSILGRADLARRMDAHRPRVGGADESLVLSSAKNPILLLLGRDVVPVTVELSGQGGRALVVSGPNAGGKSVTLSTIGLSVAMVRHGLVPPAMQGSVVPWYDQVFTVIGDPTNMERAVSTFTGQLARLDQALERCGRGRTLVLLDELATGTEPRKGEALATAVVEALVSEGAECVVATHFDQLKRLADEDVRVHNARVGLDATGRPSYRLELGAVGESNPFDVAASVGFRKAILERAKALVGERERQLEEALSQARRLNAELLREKAETEELRRHAAEDKKRYEKELVRLRSESDRLVYEARREVLQKMKRLEEELDAIAKQAREERSRPATPATERAATGRRIEVRQKKDEVRRDMAAEAALVEGHPTEPLPAAALKVGAVVWVVGLGAEGKVVDVAGDGKRAVVQVGLMRSNVKLADLRVPKAGGKKGAPAVPKKSASRYADPAPSTVAAPPIATLGQDEEDLPFIRTPENTCDVRGMRVDEALGEVDRHLDQAYLNEVPVVMVIHGMGTSALRKAVRDYLKKCRYASRFRAGASGEGGDGVTMVEVG